MIVMLALLGCAGFGAAAVGNAALLLLAEHVPARGPLRDLAIARAARIETDDIDAEHRRLLSR